MISLGLRENCSRMSEGATPASGIPRPMNRMSRIFAAETSIAEIRSPVTKADGSWSAKNASAGGESVIGVQAGRYSIGFVNVTVWETGMLYWCVPDGRRLK